MSSRSQRPTAPLRNPRPQSPGGPFLISRPHSPGGPFAFLRPRAEVPLASRPQRPGGPFFNPLPHRPGGPLSNPLPHRPGGPLFSPLPQRPGGPLFNPRPQRPGGPFSIPLPQRSAGPSLIPRRFAMFRADKTDGLSSCSRSSDSSACSGLDGKSLSIFCTWFSFSMDRSHTLGKSSSLLLLWDSERRCISSTSAFNVSSSALFRCFLVSSRASFRSWSAPIALSSSVASNCRALHIAEKIKKKTVTLKAGILEDKMLIQLMLSTKPV